MQKVAPSEPARIVVLGGGVAGRTAAAEFVKRGAKSVTIVQANAFVQQNTITTYFLTRPALFEATANTKKGVVADIERFTVKGATYVVGTVVDIQHNALVFKGEAQGTLGFDVLVMAVGIHYPLIAAAFGQTLAERVAAVKVFNTKIKVAKSILVGGGGPVALEMVGELRRLNPGCLITVVVSGDRPLGWAGEAANQVRQWLRFAFPTCFLCLLSLPAFSACFLCLLD